jgi:hydroxymethylbilane synthase
LWQARVVAEALYQRGGPPPELVVIKTSADRFGQAPLTEIGGKRSFVKEIEDQLLAGDVDLAVHSAKDLPAILPEGLTLAAVLPRADPRDAVVRPAPSPVEGPAPSQGEGPTNASIGPGPSYVKGPSDVAAVVAAAGPAPRIGTGSVRRRAQLSRVVPGATFAPIRGNLDTRLRKLDEGRYDLLILAAAGLNRLGFGARIAAPLPVELCVPAPGQGAIAVETRSDAAIGAELNAWLNDSAAMAAVRAERALVAALGGGCQVPIGALALPQNGRLFLRAVVISLDGARLVGQDAQGSLTAPEILGEQTAAVLLHAGAGEILAEVGRPAIPEQP